MQFQASEPGVYKQMICFDFTGQAPYVVRQLHVFVGNEGDQGYELERYRYTYTVSKADWNSSNVRVVPSDWPNYDREAFARQLLAKWKPLGAALENDSSVLRTRSYGPDNYKSVMHALVRLEEAAVVRRVDDRWDLVQGAQLSFNDCTAPLLEA